ncbi:MAG TPA: hypothetical protein VKG43_10050, partial [Acidimicrobiales bacterium]|nr:hypothetical protein [Acidimicrobiales bacterium]
ENPSYVYPPSGTYTGGATTANWPNCQAVATAAPNPNPQNQPPLPATPGCTASTPWGSGGVPACILAIAGGGGGGGYATATAPVSNAVCTVTGTVGGDGGPVAGSAGPTSGGDFIPGGNNSAGSNGANSTTVGPVFDGNGTNGTFGVPTAAGGGGAGYTGGAGGSVLGACGGGGATTWYATAAPGTGGSSISISPILNGPNTCKFQASGFSNTDCSGSVSLTGPLQPPTAITELATHEVPVSTTNW